MSPITQEDVEKIISELSHELAALEGKSILITGAGGMLASYIVYTLLHLNDTSFKNKATLYLMVRGGKKPFGEREDITYLDQDISQTPVPAGTYHYIIHAASKAAPQEYLAGKIDTLNTNILGTYNTLSAVTQETNSFLLYSSGEVYGNPEPGTTLDETYVGVVNNLSDRSCYVEGKRAAEAICMNYFWEKNVPVKIARIFHTFGPGVDLNDGRVFSDFLRDGMQKGTIAIKGNPSFKRSLLYIADMTTMIFKLLLSDKNGEVYNIAGNENVSVKELANIVQSALKDEGIQAKVIEENQDSEVYKTAPSDVIPDISKFSSTFGYKPVTSLQEAFSKTIQYLKK